MNNADTSTTPINGTFCIDQYEDAASADVRIKDPISGALTGIVIQVAGPEHPERKRIAFERDRRMRLEMSKTGKLPVGDPREDELDAIATLAACTLGWTAPAGSGMPEYSRQAAHELYTHPKRQWLRRQVQAGMNEAEAFIVRSAAA